MSIPGPETRCRTCGGPLAGERFCPACGTPAAPPVQYWPTVQYPTVPPQPPKSHATLIIVAFVLVAVVALGIFAGSYFWGLSAVDSVYVSCVTTGVSDIGLTSATGTLTVGVQNPSGLTLDADWTVAINYPAASFVSEQTFTIPAGGVAYPTFSFTVTLAQAGAVSGTPSVTLNTVYRTLIYTYSKSATSYPSASSASTGASLPTC